MEATKVDNLLGLYSKRGKNEKCTLQRSLLSPSRHIPPNTNVTKPVISRKIIQPMRTIFLLFALQLIALTALSGQDYYTVKFPDDVTVVGCGAQADVTWPEITKTGYCGFNVGVSMSDMVFTLNASGGCKKILRTWKLLWWCDYNPNWAFPTYIENPGYTNVGATAVGNAFNHGYLQYVQVIKILDNNPPVFLNCPTTTPIFCDYTNNDPLQFNNGVDRCEGPVNLNVKVTDVCSKSDIGITYRLFLDLDGDGIMETYRSSADIGAWPIERTVTADTVFAKIKLPAGVGLPYGNHKVEWIASDGCGNQSICKYDFIVKDCKPPTVACFNGLSINIMPSGMITIWASDFLKQTYDNCTPTPEIKIGLRKANTGVGFPSNSPSLTFDCNEIGTNLIELWAADAYGNADYCSTYLIVQDPFGACTPPGPLTGNIHTDQLQMLAGVKMQLKSNLNVPVPQQAHGLTDNQGNFQFAAAPGTCNYTLKPSLDTLPQLGVTTLDALLIARYIAGQDTLLNPYRIIAADVNHDGKVTSADVDSLTNVVTGISPKFYGNTAWRFVPAAFTFPAPKNPLASPFPEAIKTVCPMTNGQNQHFMAIKTGDVDGSLTLNSLTAADNRTKSGAAYFRLPNRSFTAGETVTVEVYTPDLTQVQGFQLGLVADPRLLTLQSVIPGLVPTQALGVFPTQNRAVASWQSTASYNGTIQRAFTLTFQAMQNGTVQEALTLDAKIAAEAYDRELQTKNVALQFEQPTVIQERAIFYPVAPNPTTGPIHASYWLPTAGLVTLTLTDINGRLIQTTTKDQEAGYQQTELLCVESGVLFLHLQWPGGAEVQRVVVQK